QKQLGSGVLMYVMDQKGTLPGPVHICIYLDTGTYSDRNVVVTDNTKLNWGAQLPSFIQRYLSDGSKAAKSVDATATCPSADHVVERSVREELRKNNIRPWHYLLNSVCSVTRCTPGVWPYYTTNPPAYFGTISMNTTRSEWQAKMETEPNGKILRPPKKLDVIRNSSKEWVIADGWYWDAAAARGSSTCVGTYPYATASQGDGVYSIKIGNPARLVVPSYPFHNTTASFSSDLNSSDHDKNSPRLTTGRTNTVYFDGHAASVRLWKGSGNPLF
ncbi:MAG TPA: hypothetical protein PLC79_04665, partial [Phycisphaerae bacterium]|nr:hypothetical protein [Phycisphaerae bacterium]